MIGGGREKGGTAASGAQSWRELAGPRRRRIKSPQARKRRREQWLKLLAVAVLAIAAVAAPVLWLTREPSETESSASFSPPSRPVQRILFHTDGVLPDGWLGGVLRLKPGTRMMEVDIHAVKAALEAEGQVKSARVERVFPDSLKIVVEERVPVFRIRAAKANGAVEERIVARDGTIYEGTAYPRSTLRNLPYLKPYRHPDGGYRPLVGIERVAELLALAREKSPRFFATWQIVSLEHYSGDPDLPGQVIEVRTRLVPRIIFGATGDFDRQLDRLASILSVLRSQGDPSIERIDLSLKNSAAVLPAEGPITIF